ncbi:MAG: hypothetical protein AVDCRST_MAG13-3907, partial [uncultured Solirubrobacteraceae bacterium]
CSSKVSITSRRSRVTPRATSSSTPGCWGCA